jgi:hypothetical protein
LKRPGLSWLDAYRNKTGSSGVSLGANLRGKFMPDDKTKVGQPDRRRVSADQDYEVRNIVEKFGLTASQVRELMLRVGNDCEDVERAAKELSGRS